MPEPPEPPEPPDQPPPDLGRTPEDGVRQPPEPGQTPEGPGPAKAEAPDPAKIPEASQASEPAEAPSPGGPPPEDGVPLSPDPSGLTTKLPVSPAAALFLGIGLFVAVITAIYWFTAYEDAGTVMLLLTAAMALWFGAYLWLRQRRAETVEEPTATEAAIGSSYLPHASVWPFVMGLGAATLVNGLVLGIWVVVPGAAALAFGLGGFIRQTRRRD